MDSNRALDALEGGYVLARDVDGYKVLYVYVGSSSIDVISHPRFANFKAFCNLMDKTLLRLDMTTRELTYNATFPTTGNWQVQNR